MFHKDIRVKSNNQIKSSEKKGIIKDVLTQYPSINEDELKSIIRVKESEITLTKISTHDNNDVFVYIIDRIPYFYRIDKDNQLLPTVYFLWKFPNVLPNKFYTHKQVFNKLLNGADLMLPGLIVDGQIDLYTFKGVEKNQLCSICLDNNSVPIACGRTVLSGQDMYMSAMRGRGVAILHIFKDNLWMLGDQSLQPPFIEKIKLNANELKPENREADKPKEYLNEEIESLEKLKLEEECENEGIIQDQQQQQQDSGESEELKLDDELLKAIFFAALKYKSKEMKLPLIVSTFTKILQDCSPKELNFDLKQTSYKKISTFLKEMQSFGCIQIKEIQKGVLAISGINKEHELIKFTKKPLWLSQSNAEEHCNNVNFVLDVLEMHKIDGNTDELFKRQYRKGDVLSSQEIRQYIMNYIKEENLQSQENKRMVKLDDVFLKILKKSYSNSDTFLTFEGLFSETFDKLSPMHSIIHKYSDNKEREPPVLRKGKFRPIEFKIESRGGNKKLSVIYNLNEFSIEPKEILKEIRTKLGCSASFEFLKNSAASNISEEFTITVQGNQINQIVRLLKSEYGIQTKHMIGLDLAIKE